MSRTSRASSSSAPRHARPDAPRGGWRDERGSQSIEMLLLLPAMFALVFLGVQGAFWYHARTVAIAAAQEGARTGAQLGSTASAGIAAARGFATSTDVLDDVAVTGDRSPTTVRVTVTGTSPSLLPGVSLHVSAGASAPVERVTAP